MYISIIQEHEVKEILIKVYHLQIKCFQGIRNIFFPVRKAHYAMGVMYFSLLRFYQNYVFLHSKHIEVRSIHGKKKKEPVSLYLRTMGCS